MAAPVKKTGSKKSKKNVPNGVVHIQSTFNNTIVSITDTSGHVISWSSAGASGFKGARKGTPFAAQTAAEAAAKRALDQGMRQIEVLVRGPGSGRETAIRALQVAGLEITLIRDVTPLPHNGCRRPKRRRVLNLTTPPPQTFNLFFSVLQYQIDRIDHQISDDRSQTGTFLIGPLERGQATTLGNSLRRVLMGLSLIHI